MMTCSLHTVLTINTNSALGTSWLSTVTYLCIFDDDLYTVVMKINTNSALGTSWLNTVTCFCIFDGDLYTVITNEAMVHTLYTVGTLSHCVSVMTSNIATENKHPCGKTNKISGLCVYKLWISLMMTCALS